jgi:hypothetical protein
MAKAAGQLKQWEYNARDGWATLVSLLGLLEEIPAWTVQNHLIKFPLWPACLDANLEGFLCDNNARAELIAKDKQVLELEESQT